MILNVYYRLYCYDDIYHIKVEFPIISFFITKSLYNQNNFKLKYLLNNINNFFLMKHYYSKNKE